MEESKVIELLQKMYSEKVKSEKVVESYDKLKRDTTNQVAEYFTENGLKNIAFEIEDENAIAGKSFVSATMCEKQKVDFDIQKLKKVLSKEHQQEVINKTYEIQNPQMLFTYLKSCGVDANYFKQFLTITEKVDSKKLDKLYELGKIEKDDLNGTFTVGNVTKYITFRNKKSKD